MSLNYEDCNSPKRENYLNGSIDDFTDCIDFTNQYQKSCSAADNEVESAYQSSASSNADKDYYTSESKLNDYVTNRQTNKGEEKKSSLNEDNSENLRLSSPQNGTTDFENDSHPMEPDVSITVGESNLEKTINHVAKGVDSNEAKVLYRQVNGGTKSKIIKKRSSQKVYRKKNHLKLPLNKNIKKKAVLKIKNGKHMKQKSKTFQYQGLQSNIKFKCYKCSVSDFSSITELQAHQRKCINSSQELQSIHESTSSLSSPTNSSNFRITRKVYLCSACGSYYENWNLFLHMKEMHKRHICLYCLGMFSHPDKLAQHLLGRHNVIEQTLSSVEEFNQLYRGTCYLICCTCEAMFSEQEEFYEHSCEPYSVSEEVGACPLCGLQGTHFPNCRKAVNDRRTDIGSNKSHPSLAKKFLNKKKKFKTNKKPKEIFRIINNENNGEMSVTVKKQNTNEEDTNDTHGKENSVHKEQLDFSMTSPLRLGNEDLVSTKQYNEKMLQLYKHNKSSEKVISSIQSIEDSINRVVENLGAYDDEDDADADDEHDLDDSNAVSDVNVSCFTNTSNTTVFAIAAVEEDDRNRKSNETPYIREEKELFQTLLDNRKLGSSKKEESSTKYAEDNDKVYSDVSQGEIPQNRNNLLKKNEREVLSDNDSSDSEKLTIAFDQPYESANDKTEETKGENEYKETNCEKSDDNVPTAGAEAPYVYIPLKEDFDDEKALIKELVKESSWNCVYCAHAKRIAVNGKQLALHILAEHRFVTCPEDSTEEEKNSSALNIVQRLKNNLLRLENCYFNTDTFDSKDKSFWNPNDRIYECFHCLFATYVHKELYSHNRKMHQKAVFLCIMCKSNFYNYSELLCHLCPGIYVPGQVINPDITYRCFLCNVDPLPSSFRLMVHLRRRHNSCDICFDQSSNQFQLSTHVWKHKLSHMCYRCGIAYRNKPDITKHLFWKHGTESVLCKKCLQKKWPHVYHFCVPPNSFICDECSVSLKSAVALKVHKRLHSREYPYQCDKCDEKFISRKLLAKHVEKHNQEQIQSEVLPVPEMKEKEKTPAQDSKQEDMGAIGLESEKKQEKEKKSKKRKVLTDVFDLPPVNLSESDDSDQDLTVEPKIVKQKTPEPEEPPIISNGLLNGEFQKEDSASAQIVDNVWNNFKNYMDRKEFPKTFRPASPFKNMSLSRIKAIMLSDHDYHIIPNSNQQDANSSKPESEKSGGNNAKVGLDHDYCNNNTTNSKSSAKSKLKSKHKEERSKSSSSESSSDSDSSCSCGSNCSCSTGSSSSTSSNDSDSDSREKRKDKKKISKEVKVNKVEPEPAPDIDISVHDVSNENAIQESDLDTEETETDEDFYDYNPAREANRVLAEKRTQLLANLNGSDTFASSPSTPTDKIPAPKKKSEVKKKRSQFRAGVSAKNNRKKTSVPAPLTFNSIPGSNGNETNCDFNANGAYESSIQPFNRLQHEDGIRSSGESDAKRPKRKRVPLKFYGFSSDEESDPVPASRKREKNEHNTTTPAPQTPSAPPPDLDANMWNSQSRGSLSWRIEKSDSAYQKVNPIKIRTSQTKQSSNYGNTANSDFYQTKRTEKSSVQVNGSSCAAAAAVATATSSGQKGDKLYCFCQCPYDEVSEMIACDAEDCVIEWFHFECVGIMVPPKGSWYCPDCRKKFAAENEFMSPPINEQNIN